MAARHLCWRMEGRATTPFCPAAQAVLRWRIKWEGFGSPDALLRRPLHGPLGIDMWLSRYAPIGSAEWSDATCRWLTLHLFMVAWFDSFYTFLREAQQARSHERIVWWPFPVHDFPQRELIAQGRDRPDDPARFRLTSLETGQGSVASPSHVPGSAGHRKQHARLLGGNRMPLDAVGFPPPPRSAPHLNLPTGLARDSGGPVRN